MMGEKSEIKVGAIISYLTIAVNIVLGLIYTPWTLKIIGSSEYGLYTLTSSLISIFLLDFGMSAAVTRYISNFRAVNKQKSINEFVGLSIKLYIGLCVTITLILSGVFLFIDSIYVGLSQIELQKFKIVFIINAFFIILSFPVNICNGILNAYEKFFLLKVSDILNKIGTVIVTIIVLLLGGKLYSLVFINGLLNFLIFIIKIIIVHIKTPVEISFSRDENISLRDIFSFSIWSTVNSISQQMTTNLIPSVLGMTSSTFSITIYGFARTVEGYVYNITQAINGLFMPTVSRIIVESEDAKEVLPLMVRVGRINQSVINLLLLGFMLLGDEFVKLWVGEKYKILFPCILLLILPYVISASQQIAGTSIVVLNKIKYTSIINIVVSLLTLVIAYFVSIGYGVLGVCVVNFIGLIIKIVLCNIVYVKVLRIDIGAFFKECQIKLIPASIMSIVLSMIIVYLLKGYGYSWKFFLIRIICISLVYFVSMWLIGWNDFEKELILSIINSTIKKIKKTDLKER